MIRRPPRSTRTDTLFPYTTLFRSIQSGLSTSDDMPEPLSPDRFNEEKAAYTVRGAGQPDLETGIAAIRETLKTLPPRPGVYRMQDARGDVLYVGKARRSEEHTSELQSLMRTSYAVFCLTKKQK